jgi:asparagine synthase (glutamine-hydrolysing)
VPLFFVSKLARDHVKVVLTGEGSDELLAGYGKYPRALLNWRAGSVYTRAVPGMLRARLAAAIDRVPGRIGRYARRSFLAIEHLPDLTFFDTFAGINLSRQQALLSPRLAALADHDRAYAASMAYFNAPGKQSDLLDRILYADMKTYLVELLMKQDQMSMAASIESRVPFLDHHLVEFAAGLPANRKLSGFSTKRILRDAVRDVLPRKILERSKMGFPVPFASWIRNGWADVVRDVLLDRRARQRGVTNAAAIEQLLSSATAPGVAGGQDADAVWSLFNLELWYRTFIDGDGVQSLPAPRATPAPAPALESEPARKWSA